MEPEVEQEIVRLVRLAQHAPAEAERALRQLRRTARRLGDQAGEVACLRLLAVLAKGEGSGEKARKAYAAILKMRPDDVAALLGFGHACERLGRFVEAWNALKKARDLSGSDQGKLTKIDDDMDRIARRIRSRKMN